VRGFGRRGGQVESLVSPYTCRSVSASYLSDQAASTTERPSEASRPRIRAPSKGHAVPSKASRKKQKQAESRFKHGTSDSERVGVSVILNNFINHGPVWGCARGDPLGKVNLRESEIVFIFLHANHPEQCRAGQDKMWQRSSVAALQKNTYLLQ
jgi:hypothetical protein